MAVDLHIFITPCSNESRFIKESKTLINNNLFDNVIAIGIYKDGLKRYEVLSHNRIIIRIKINSFYWTKNIIFQVVKYLEYVIKLINYVKIYDVIVVHAHSLGSLPAGFILKILHGLPLIYDAHELETETNGLSGIRKIISKITEKILIRFVDEIIVVTPSIAEWYEKKYKVKRPWVIKNVPNYEMPLTPSSNILKEKFNIQKNDILFLYQGKMSPGRNIELLLNVFTKISNASIVFMGYGALVDLIKTHSSKYNNIFYQETISNNKLKIYTSSADVGVAIPENNCLSHYYGLGNKHFEYLLSGIPILVANYPERASLVNQNNCGWVIEPKENNIIEFIKSLTIDDVYKKKKAAIECSKIYNWEIEGKKLIKLYKRII